LFLPHSYDTPAPPTGDTASRETPQTSSSFYYTESATTETSKSRRRRSAAS
jgi:hypothetical protein